MGAVALICGRKRLKAVEPERSKEFTAASPSNSKSAANGGHRTAKPHCATDWTAEMSDSEPEKSPDGVITATSKSNSWSKLSSVRVAEQVANKYENRGLLGKGRYSHVLQVQDRSTRGQYALKVVQKLPGLEQEGNNYQVEIDILKKCSHANIVPLCKVLYYPGQVYLLLELALGGDLFDHLANHGPLSETRARSVLKMVVEGVAYLHNSGITHRDLKLENLLFKTTKEDSPILIADFGLAHVASSGRVRSNGCYMTSTCGTAEYMSPEMLKGEEYSNKVDMWAVGVVTYVVLSGHMPFVEGAERGGRAVLYQKIMAGAYSTSDKVDHAKLYSRQNR